MTWPPPGSQNIATDLHSVQLFGLNAAGGLIPVRVNEDGYLLHSTSADSVQVSAGATTVKSLTRMMPFLALDRYSAILFWAANAEPVDPGDGSKDVTFIFDWSMDGVRPAIPSQRHTFVVPPGHGCALEAPGSRLRKFWRVSGQACSPFTETIKVNWLVVGIPK